MNTTVYRIPFWDLKNNPIVQRYRRSRLRKQQVLLSVLLLLISITFLFSLIYIPTFYRLGSAEEAARNLVIPLLVIQGFILMLLGTGTIAGGLSQEAVERTDNYQRLTPLSPIVKIVGYLFGLPIREYLLFFLTLPFTAFVVVIGNIPFTVALKIYLAFLSCTLLYHLTGFVAVICTNRRRYVGQISQGLVVALYLLLPRLSVLGIHFFDYLTIFPVLKKYIIPLIPDKTLFHIFENPYKFFDFGHFFAKISYSSDHVPFFDWHLSPLLFSLIIQILAITTFVTIVYRKWQQPSRHILGKKYALYFQIGIHFFMLGTILPTTQRKDIHPAYLEFSNIVFGLISLGVTCLLILIITPRGETFLRALRRQHKLNLKKIPIKDDGSNAPWHTFLIVFVGSIAWLTYSLATIYIGQKAENPSVYLVDVLLILMPYILVTLSLYMITFIWEKQGTLFFFVLAWMVPIMIATVMVTTNFNLLNMANHLSSISPLTYFTNGYHLSIELHYPEPTGPFCIATIIYVSFLIFGVFKMLHRQNELKKKALSTKLLASS